MFRTWLFVLFILLSQGTSLAVDQRSLPGEVNNEISAVVLNDYPPFSFKDKNGEFKGFAIDSLREIAKAANLKIRFVEARNWEEARMTLIDGRADVIGGMAPSHERIKSFVFTDPFFVSPVKIMIRSEYHTAQTVYDLSGMVLGGIYETMIPPVIKNQGDVTFKSFSAPRDYIVSLLSGDIDGAIGGKHEMEFMARKLRVQHLVGFLSVDGAEYKRSIAMLPQNTQLKEVLSKSVQKFVSSPSYSHLVDKWYGPPRPFWTEPTVMIAIAFAFLGAVIFLLVSHHLRVVGLNRQLSKALKESCDKTIVLEKNRDMFQQLVENIKSIFWIRDFQSKDLLYVSPNSQEIFDGDSRSALENLQSYLDIVCLDDRAKVLACAMDLYQNKVPLNMEHRIIHSDGSIRWVHACGYHLPATANIPERIIGFLEDVTAQKSSELSLQESETMYRTFFMDSSVAMLIIDPDNGDIIDSNNAAAAYYGWSRDKLKTMSITDINVLPPDEIRAEISKTKKCQKRHFSFKHILATNEIRDVDVYSGPITINGKEVVYSCIIDCTSRIIAEDALKQKELFQRAIVECSPVALYGIDLDWNVTSWNHYAENLFGWKSEETIGKKLLNIPDHKLVELNCLRREALLKGVVVGQDFVHKDRFGNLISTSLSLSIIRSSEGHPVGMLSAVQDMRKMKEAEKQLLAAKEEAEAANQAKSDFLANMSHEIRTPLNGFMGMLQLLETTDLNEEQSEYVTLAGKSCTRLTRLLSDILDLSKVEAGQMTIQNCAFSLKELFEQVSGIFAPISKQTSIRFERKIYPHVVDLVNGDSLRLQQIFLNLLGNAFKFTSSGTVCFDISLIPTSKLGQQRLLCMVSDTGIGIPTNKINTLFKPFSQVSEGYARNHQGAGLGLAICKRLVALMGGTIFVDSQVEEGTSIYLSIPFALTEPKSIEVDSTIVIEKHPLSGARVLVAEDDPTSMFATTRFLEKNGAIVESVQNGRQALDRARSDCFDLILMDIQMPELDGVAATKAIRSGEAGSKNMNIPIVAMTAYAMKEDREIFMENGMDAYLSKPIHAHEMTKVLQSVVCRQSQV